MSLLFMEGFGSGDTTSKWDPVSSTFSSNSATPRTPGGFYGSNTTNPRSLYKTIPASAQVFVGFGWNSPNYAPYVSFYGDGGTTQHITVVRNGGSGLLEIRRGTSGGTVLGVGTQPLLPSQWNYIEISVTIADAGGQVHVRLNGSTTDEVSYTGDTKNGGTATTIDRVFFSFPSTVGSVLISDVYILNDSGSAPNNNFLGDVVVRTLSPVGNGTYSQLVGSDSDSINNYQLVDERPFSSTDYVGSATPGDKDSYAIADLPSGVSTVYGVQVSGQMFKSDATLAQSRLLLRSGGTDYGGVTRALTTTPTNYYELYETDPATGLPWTQSGVNNMETGMEVM